MQAKGLFAFCRPLGCSRFRHSWNIGKVYTVVAVDAEKLRACVTSFRGERYIESARRGAKRQIVCLSMHGKTETFFLCKFDTMQRPLYCTVVCEPEQL